VHPTRLRGFRQGQSPGFGLDAGRGASSLVGPSEYSVALLALGRYRREASSRN
jgi:hypothetical protein